MSRKFLTTVGCIASCLVACTGSDIDEQDVGQVALEIAAAPTDVRCLSIQATSAARTVTQKIDITPGQPVSAPISGVPTGSVTIVATAYETACSSVTANSTPTWTGDPPSQVITVTRGARVPLALVLRPSGTIVPTVDWQDDAVGGATGAGGSTATGGAAMGGAATGGAATGGATTCTPDWGTVPSTVSAWVDESWNAQLGANVRGMNRLLLDSAMKGNGQINLCVRWGATSAPTAAVKSGMAGAVQKWLNDWFSQLAGYGCFPYSTITAKVTGWAVKPGNTGWVSDLGSDVKVYTEVDGEGEPKCPDNCSFFTNWTHTFPNCSGGEAFHHDYWLWLDDSIGGGAAAVGGDWGLRMPVSNFISAMNQSNLVIEHEMGHGFGFQDYYDWTGSTPTGGSLMIAGSTASKTPTTADTWLLRRTWKESKALRGW